MSNIRAIRGMNDILPDETPSWQYIEGAVRQLMAGYGYSEIRLPIVEQTDLFRRGVGEATGRPGRARDGPCWRPWRDLHPGRQVGL